MLSVHPVHATYAAVSYYTRQVGRDDGVPTPNEYYSMHGGKPGVWRITDACGLDLPGNFPLKNTAVNGGRVHEEQMLRLAVGMHPDTDRINEVFRLKGMKSSFSFAFLGQASRESRTRTAFEIAVEAGVVQWREDNEQPVGDVPSDVKSGIRTSVGAKFFEAEFGHPPGDDAAFATFMTRVSKPGNTPLAYWDLSFSPVKSVSLLWALGDIETSRQVEAVHAQAVEEAMRYFEENYLFTREGRGGVRQVHTLGSISAVYEHRESRLGDPDLHTHVVLANRVRSATSGKWLAIDGRDVFKGTVAASEFYNTRIEALLSERFGVVWRSVEHGVGKRVTREITGFTDALIDAFSKRNRAVRVKQAELVEQFRQTHNRWPNKAEAMKLAQTANLMLRTPKPGARSFAQQRSDWREEAESVLGVNVKRVLWRVTHSLRKRPVALSWGDIAGMVLHTVSEERAAFSRNHVEAETWRRAREFVAPADQRDAVSFIRAEVLSRCVDLAPRMLADTPDALLRSDGVSQYRHVAAELFTTEATLAAMNRIVDAAGRSDGWGVAPGLVERIIARMGEHGIDGGEPLNLSASQRNMVSQLACSNARVRLALAPAGTGKTVAMGALAEVIRQAGGNVIGASHQAVAAQELYEALGDVLPCVTLASLTYPLRGLGANRWARDVNDLVDSINERSVLIVDEAGMASTADLDVVINLVTSRGGSVVLIGDDRQLGSIGAGGVLRDIHADHGSCTLRELRRFKSASEGQATLGLRDGNRDALGFYIENERIHAAVDVSVLDELFTGWKADVMAGEKSLMLAHLHTDVFELNAMAQAWRRELGIVDAKRTVALGDGSACGAGDVIVTRKNERKLRVSGHDWVRNRNRWVVQRVGLLGELHVVKEGAKPGSKGVVLPASYVKEFVELGYASTINGVQGVTVDVARALFRGDEDLAALYVALSRGRLANHAHVAIGGDSDPHSIVFDDADRVQTAVEKLAGIMAAADANVSAGSVIRDQIDPFSNLSTRTLVYYDALQQALIFAVGEANVDAITARADQALQLYYPRNTQRLSDYAAWPSLQQRLLSLCVNAGGGEHGVEVAIGSLQAAIRARGLFKDDDPDAARDVAAVLCWRTDQIPDVETQPGPLPWLPGVPNALIRRLEQADMDPKWLEFLATYSVAVTDSARAVHATAAAWTWDSAPRWTLPLLVNHRELVNDLAVWRAVNGVKANEITPLGVTSSLINTVAAIREHNRLEARLDAAVGAAQWEPYVHERVVTDPMWPVIAARLEASVQQTATGFGVPRGVLQQTLTELRDQTPTPLEYAASALWSLMTERIEALIPSNVNLPQNGPARPLWAYQVAEHLPPGRVSDLFTSPMWPALVQCVATLDPRNITATMSVALAFAGDPTNRQLVDNVEAWIAHLTHTLQSISDVDTYGADTFNEPDTATFENAPSVEDDAFLAAIMAERDQATTKHTKSEALVEPVETGSDEAELDTDLGTQPARIIELNEMAAAFFTHHYPRSTAAAATARRFGTDLAGDTRFGFGYAPPGWDHLTKHLLKRGATDSELIDAGLAKYSKRGTLIDLFRNRIITTIRDEQGVIVGFSGRTLEAETEFNPKYFNTPTTAVFTKGSVFFGAHLLESGKQLVLVEGPMDAVAITQTGDAIGLAVGGTALTANQIRLLTPYLHDPDRPLIVATDNDEAGDKAAKRDHERFTEALGYSIVPARRMMFDGYKDPGEVIENGDTTLIRDALADPESLPTLATAVFYSHVLPEYQSPFGDMDEQLFSDKEHSILIDEATDLLATLPPEYREVEATRLALDLYRTRDILNAPDVPAAVAKLIDGLVWQAQWKAPAATDETPPADPHELEHEPQPVMTTDPDPQWGSLLDRVRANVENASRIAQGLVRQPATGSPSRTHETPRPPRIRV